jgi:hypothetical protein
MPQKNKKVPVYKEQGFLWAKKKYKVKRPKNVGGSKDSAGCDLIEECLPKDYQSTVFLKKINGLHDED